MPKLFSQAKPKPASAKPASASASASASVTPASASAKPATVASATVAKPASATVAKPASASATESAPVRVYKSERDSATIRASATAFAEYSDRDTAYIVFFGLVMRQHNDSATLGQIHAAGTQIGNGRARNPFYTGSAKATDAGAINRLIKAGYITASESGNRLTATPLALASAAYNSAPIPA